MNNFQDTFHHLWDRSRPTIVEMERKIKRKKAKLIISTEIEALVESLFLEEIVINNFILNFDWKVAFLI